MIKLIEQLGALAVQLCGLLNNKEAQQQVALCVLLAANSSSICPNVVSLLEVKLKKAC